MGKMVLGPHDVSVKISKHFTLYIGMCLGPPTFVQIIAKSPVHLRESGIRDSTVCPSQCLCTLQEHNNNDWRKRDVTCALDN